MSGIFQHSDRVFVDGFLTLLVVLLVVLGCGVALARRKRLRAHRRVMKGAYALFVSALVVFEVAVRAGWQPVPHLAAAPFAIHLCFALPCTVLWTYQVATRGRAFTAPEGHHRRGYAVFALLAATVATGIWVYAATF